MIILLDDSTVTFCELEIILSDFVDESDAIKAVLFNEYNLSPLNKYKIFYELNRSKKSRDCYFVYFASEEILNQELSKNSSKSIEYAIFTPQVFGLLFQKLGLTTDTVHLFIFLNRAKHAICIYKNAQLSYVRYISDVSQVQEAVSDIDCRSIDHVHICDDISSDIVALLRGYIDAPFGTLESPEKLLANREAVDFAYNFSTKQRVIALLKRPSGHMILSALLFASVLIVFELSSFYFQKIELKSKVSKESDYKEKISKLQSQLEALNSQISTAKNEQNTTQSELNRLLLSLNELESMRQSESITSTILTIANQAKGLDIYFDKLCIVSNHIRIISESTNPVAISEFASKLALSGIEVDNTKIDKDEDTGYKGSISALR